jgi:2-keto-4-pentenoate hydratase/2-oxohepta-3-ene-1,7-dioic acid hydratase in catechol pathway
MGIVRFEDETGAVHFGIEQGDGQAEVLAKDPLQGVERTGRIREIRALKAPVSPVNIFGIGLNYRRHAEETGLPLPAHPVIFMKATSAVIGPGEAILLPRCQMTGPEVDYEAELAVIIGRTARNVPEKEALSYVLGYTAANDVSARRWQKQGGGGQWVRGKSFDTFCPLGPRIAFPEEVGDPQGLPIRSRLGGEVMQESSTRDMIFSVAELISRLSMDTTLLPGTVILTGTPEGVGFVRRPPRFLEAGDTITVEVGGIGRLTNPVEDA